MNKTYVLSGYFVRFHEGHRKYIESVLDIMDSTDSITIIVNNAKQQEMKYGKVIKDPIEIINEISKEFPICSYEISQSSTRSVSADLIEMKKYYGNIVFVKDGDRNSNEIPERFIEGIEFLDLKNPKINSSSKILKEENILLSS